MFGSEAGYVETNRRHRVGSMDVDVVDRSNQEKMILAPPGKRFQSSHWTRTPGRPRRVATWFFVAHVPMDRVEVTIRTFRANGLNGLSYRVSISRCQMMPLKSQRWNRYPLG